MTSLPLASTSLDRSLANGESVSSSFAWRDSKSSPEAGDRPAFPPGVIVEVKALACELPSRFGLPLSRFSLTDIRHEVLAQGGSQREGSEMDLTTLFEVDNYLQLLRIVI